MLCSSVLLLRLLCDGSYCLNFHLVCETHQRLKFQNLRFRALLFVSVRFPDSSLRCRDLETRLKFAKTHDFSSTILMHSLADSLHSPSQLLSDIFLTKKKLKNINSML